MLILGSIDSRYGGLNGVEFDDIESDEARGDFELEFCTRFAASFGRLIIDPDLAIKAIDYEHLLLRHRWIDLIFTLSGFRSSDPFLRQLGNAQGENKLAIEDANLPRFLAMLTLNSRVVTSIDFEQLWRADKISVASAFTSYLRSRYVFRPRAFAFRERLLEWLPDKLDQVTLGSMTLSHLQDLYMHCSYAISPKKHAIKAKVMAQMRRTCLKVGISEIEPGKSPLLSERPTVVIVCEEIKFDHSIYRTHSAAMCALRERFNVVGIVYRDQISSEINDLFDETVAMPEGDYFEVVREISEEIRRRSPAVIIFPSLGMRPHAIALASVRLAPIQCASYGHAASTRSLAIDYMVLPEDFVGSSDRFSEKLLALPGAAMPFRPPHLDSPVCKAAPDRKEDGKVRVGIPSSVMKLNPNFFAALKRISTSASTPTEFQFFPLGSFGLAHAELTRVTRSVLPASAVFRQLSYGDYLERLSKCDFILCPFPYGNTNSIVDAILVGLPGICLDGPEPHSHIDAGLFHRMGFPDQLTTNTIDDYVSEAVRMIDDVEWRVHCRVIAFNCDLDKAFFRGDAGLFCDAIVKLVWPKGASDS